MKENKSKDFFKGFYLGLCVVGAIALIMLTAFWIFL